MLAFIVAHAISSAGTSMHCAVSMQLSVAPSETDSVLSRHNRLGLLHDCVPMAAAHVYAKAAAPRHICFTCLGMKHLSLMKAASCMQWLSPQVCVRRLHHLTISRFRQNTARRHQQRKQTSKLVLGFIVQISKLVLGFIIQVCCEVAHAKQAA